MVVASWASRCSAEDVLTRSKAVGYSSRSCRRWLKLVQAKICLLTMALVSNDAVPFLKACGTSVRGTSLLCSWLLLEMLLLPPLETF